MHDVSNSGTELVQSQAGKTCTTKIQVTGAFLG